MSHLKRTPGVTFGKIYRTVFWDRMPDRIDFPERREAEIRRASLFRQRRIDL